MQYRGYHDFYSNGPYAPYLLQRLAVGSTTARLLYVSQPAGAFPDPPLPEYLVYLGVRGARRLSFDWGCGRWAGAWHADDISIAPPDTETDITVDQPHAFLGLALPVSFVVPLLDELVPGRAASFGRLHTSTFRDAAVAGYCREVWRQTCHADGAGDKLATDSLLFAMMAALARRARGRLPDIGSKLDGQPLARVLDLIDDRLTDNPSLRDHAAAANLSPMHFARQFRRATGRSPHQYVMGRRIARAQALLGLTRHRLAEIALAAGFSSQAHMTAAFARGLGITPLRYRALRRG
jgi:AraC family transcriptional regulator